MSVGDDDSQQNSIRCGFFYVVLASGFLEGVPLTGTFQALEKIAVWGKLFQDAARLLLVLGEAENENWGNNASGIFVGLFSPAYGQVAPTECSPQERFVVLKEAMESDSQERRKLALRACSTALETDHFSRMVGAEHQGLRKERNNRAGNQIDMAE